MLNETFIIVMANFVSVVFKPVYVIQSKLHFQGLDFALQAVDIIACILGNGN